MEINLPAQLVNRIAVVSSPPEIKNWQTGQLLKAVATNNSQNGQVTLLIGRHTVEAKTPLPIQSGQTLTLEVAKQGELPLLKIVTNASNKTVVEQAIRQSLPRQSSQTTLLANLSNLTQLTTGTQKNVLPTTILQAIRTFLKVLPDQKQVSTPDGLKKSLRNSGNFLESKLANPAKTNTIEIKQDLKGALLRLEQQVKNSYQSITRGGSVKLSTQQGTSSTSTSSPGTAASTILPKASHTPESPSGTRNTGSSAESNTKLATAIIKDPIPSQKTETTTPASRATSEPATTGTRVTSSITPGTTQSQTPTTSATTGQPTDGLLRPTPFAKEYTPPMRNGILQAQARADATLTSQDTLTRILATLIKDADSTLARMQLTQLGSQPVEGDQRQMWLLELPIRKEDGIDLFQFRIEREQENKQSQEQEDDRWTVRFTFSLQGLGPVYARISILGDIVSTTIWIQEEETSKLFNQYKDTLEQSLLRSGLVIDQFSFINGVPTNDMGFSGRPSEQIVNEKA